MLNTLENFLLRVNAIPFDPIDPIIGDITLNYYCGRWPRGSQSRMRGIVRLD